MNATITTATKYEYPENGRHSETIATLTDGRECIIDIRNDQVFVGSYRDHAADCAIRVSMGGRCNCHLIAGIDVESLLADARANGKFGRKPEPKIDAENARKADEMKDTLARSQYEYEHAEG